MAVPIDPSLLLNIFQSVAERAPVVVEFAVRIPNTPVRLLYVSGHTAERAVSPILVATVEVREAREPERFVTLLLRVDTEPESEVRFELVVARFPERVEIVVLRVDTEPERDTRFPERVLTVPERDTRFPESVLMVDENPFTVPESVEIVPLRVDILPERVLILPVILATIPLIAFCALVLVK